MPEELRPDDPDSFGTYRLLSRLGQGGMGTVYLGESAEGQRVAIKVINPDLAGSTQFLDRFRREVAAARRVRRFCTAPVLDASLDDAPLYVVTEFISGPTLQEAVEESGPLRGADLEGLAVGVATALSAIHDANLVHRDLKPSNVLLSPVGPRVIDFGIARALDAQTGVTRTGQIIGTPAFLAPELVIGGELDYASDVFSWACVVVFAGVGHGPFDGNTIPEILHRVAYEPPQLDGLDPSLRTLVERALRKSPAERPTVPEMLEQLTGRRSPEASAGSSRPQNPPPSAGPPTLQVEQGQPLPFPPPPSLSSGPAARAVEQSQSPSSPPSPSAGPPTQAVEQSQPLPPPSSGPPTQQVQQSQPSLPGPQQSLPLPPGPPMWGPQSYGTSPLPPSRHTPPPYYVGQPLPSTPPRPRRRRAGCLIVALTAIVVVVLLGVIGSQNKRKDDGSAESSGQSSQPGKSAVGTGFLGTWRGSINQEGDPKSPYPVVVTLKSGQINDVIGRSSYPTLKCSGRLTLLTASKNRLTVRENVTEGSTNCITATLTLAHRTNGSLDYSFSSPTSGHGVLKKK